MGGRGNRKGSNGGGGRIKGQKRGETKQQTLDRLARERAHKVAVEVTGEADDLPIEASAAVAPAAMKLGKEILAEAANYFFGMAAKYQPGGPEFDERKFERYLDKSADIASKLAPYQSPRLANTVLKGDKEAPLHHHVVFEFVDGSGKTVTPDHANPGGVRPALPAEGPV